MWLYRINHALGPVLGLYWRLGLTGALDTIPKSGPILLASNHLSFLDPWFVGMAFPRLVRYVITDEWFHKSRVWKALFRAYGTVPVQRKAEATIEVTCDLLAKGDVVGIFPEGGISNDGRIRRFRTGLSFMAAQSGAPVLPVGIRGSFDTLPRHRRIPRPVRVTIHVGKPVVFPGSPHAEPPSQEERRKFMELVFREICRLSGQEESAPGHVQP